MFKKFVGQGSWSTWERDGNIIIPGLFRFLAPLGQKIDMEFDLYSHHHRSLPMRSHPIWLRNIFYSIIQQTVRPAITRWNLTLRNSTCKMDVQDKKAVIFRSLSAKEDSLTSGIKCFVMFTRIRRADSSP